jgi:hypothetical protein
MTSRAGGAALANPSAVTTRLLENGKELGVVSDYQRHQKAKERSWCAFVVPLPIGLSLSKGTEHALSFDNGSTVPIRVTCVTGGVAGATVRALVP